MFQANDEQPQVEDPPQPQAINDDDNLCAVCLVNEKNAVMVPCGHARFCIDCGNECMRTYTGRRAVCPLCRAPVERCIQML